MESRSRAELAGSVTCRRDVRNAADLRRAGDRRTIRPGLLFHPYDGDKRHRLEGRRRRRRTCHVRRADRNAHAARNAAHPEGARSWHDHLAFERRRMHDGRGHVHPDARRADAAADARQRTRAEGRRLPEAHVGLGRRAPRHDGRGQRAQDRRQDRLADPRARTPTSSCSTGRRSTWRRSTTRPGPSSR